MPVVLPMDVVSVTMPIPGPVLMPRAMCMTVPMAVTRLVNRSRCLYPVVAGMVAVTRSGGQANRPTNQTANRCAVPAAEMITNSGSDNHTKQGTRNTFNIALAGIGRTSAHQCHGGYRQGGQGPANRSPAASNR
jgi:hypothetical protein